MSCSFPRPATPYEVMSLCEWYGTECKFDDAAPDCVMVIPDYITGGPGYSGELWIAVWDGAPEFVDVFILKPDRVCRTCGRGEFWHGGPKRDNIHAGDCDHEFDEMYLELPKRLERVLCGADPRPARNIIAIPLPPGDITGILEYLKRFAGSPDEEPDPEAS